MRNNSNRLIEGETRQIAPFGLDVVYKGSIDPNGFPVHLFSQVGANNVFEIYDWNLVQSGRAILDRTKNYTIRDNSKREEARL